MYTLNKHVKWRKERGEILICNCKKLMDLKVGLEFENALKKFERGFSEEDLSKKEVLLFKDFQQLKFLSQLVIRPIRKEEFSAAMNLLDRELKDRVRTNDFLYEKFKEFHRFFIGVFLDKDIVGLICGFPREDYLLISELAVDLRFRNRGYGRRLVESFEAKTRQKFKGINVGAEDNAIHFYERLEYKPFILIQFRNSECKAINLKGEQIIRDYNLDNYRLIEIHSDNADMNKLLNLRKKYPKAHIQYIFTKKYLDTGNKGEQNEQTFTF